MNVFNYTHVFMRSSRAWVGSIESIIKFKIPMNVLSPLAEAVLMIHWHSLCLSSPTAIHRPCSHWSVGLCADRLWRYHFLPQLPWILWSHQGEHVPPLHGELNINITIIWIYAQVFKQHHPLATIEPYMGCMEAIFCQSAIRSTLKVGFNVA